MSAVTLRISWLALMVATLPCFRKGRREGGREGGKKGREGACKQWARNRNKGIDA